MYDVSRPIKRRGLLSLLGSVRSEKQTESARKARFDPPASPDARNVFGPNNLRGDEAIRTGFRSLSLGRSPSIPMAAAGRRARRPGSRLEPTGGINGSSSSTDENTSRDHFSLAPLWGAIRKMDYVRSSRAPSQPLPWERRLRRQHIIRRGQRNAFLFKNSVSRVLSMRSRPKEPATPVMDKLMGSILASWRKRYAFSPSLVRTAAREPQAKAQQLEQQQQPPSLPRACPPTTSGAPPLILSSPPTTLQSGLAPTPRLTQLIDHNPAAGNGQRQRGAPAYDDSISPPTQSRSLSVWSSKAYQDKIQRSVQGHQGRASLEGSSKGADATTGRTSTGLAEGDGGVGETQTMNREGEVEPIARAKVPGNKRKLGGIVWSFGAATESSNGGAKRQTPLPLAAAGIDRNSTDVAGQSTTPGSDRALSPGEIPHRTVHGSRCDAVGASVVSHGSSESTTATVEHPVQITAPLRTSSVTTQQRGERASQKFGRDACTRRRCRIDGDGEYSPATKNSDAIHESSRRRQSFAGSQDGFVDYARSSRATGRPEDGRAAVLDSSEGKSFEGGSSRWQQQEAHGLLHFQCPPGSTEGAEPLATAEGNAAGAPPPYLETSVTGSPKFAGEGSKRTVGLTEDRKRGGSGVKARAAGSVLTSSALEKRSLDGTGGGRAGGGSGESDRCQGGVQQEREEDTAMAGCESHRQREILALIRAGTMGDTFNLHSKRRRASSGGKGRPQWSSAASSGPNVSRRRSDPIGKSTFGGVPSVLLPGDAAPPRANAVRSPDQRPLYAVVSDDFVGRAGSMVRTLSAPRGAPPSTNANMAIAASSEAEIVAQRLAFRSAPRWGKDSAALAAASSAGFRRGGLFHLLELAVERPVDLVVGSRSAIVILDSRGSGLGATSATTAAGEIVGGDRRATTTARGVSGASSSERGDGAVSAAMPSAADEREREQQAEAEMAEAKEKLRLLQLQSLKYSTIWLLVRVSK
ncbi:unnamed protein product, partial [Hapterophycus canaliculatus]